MTAWNPFQLDRDGGWIRLTREPTRFCFAARQTLVTKSGSTPHAAVAASPCSSHEDESSFEFNLSRGGQPR